MSLLGRIFSKPRQAPEADPKAEELRKLRKANVGKNSFLDPTVQVLGWKSVRIGQDCVLGEYTWLNVNHRETEEPAILIEDNCFVGRRNFFSAARRIRLGAYCLTGTDCRFLGANHVFTSPFVPYIKSGVTTEEVIDIGSNCWLGAGVTVLGNVRIGHGSIIGACTVVTRDIPPFSLAVGNPARVLRRYDAARGQWVPEGEYQETKPMPDEPEYLAALRRDYPRCKGPKLAASTALGDLP
jgi:acetyltransferase-like isoleucine patch superfamily enzyme